MPKERRLSRPRFASDRREPARGGEGRVPNERHVTDMDFIDHRISLSRIFPVPRITVPRQLPARRGASHLDARGGFPQIPTQGTAA